MKIIYIYILITIALFTTQMTIAQNRQLMIGVEYSEDIQELNSIKASTSGKTFFDPIQFLRDVDNTRMPSNDVIDPTSFSFLKLYVESEALLAPSNPHEYASANGTYSYESDLGKISFVPKSNISDESEEIYFVLKHRNEDGKIESVVSKMIVLFSQQNREYIIVNANPIYLK